MLDRQTIPAMALALVLALTGSCGHSTGRVDQGLVVEYDRAGGWLLVIHDSNFRDPANPRFDVLPPARVQTPEDPHEMGPEPVPGKLLALDLDQGRLSYYDAATETIKAVAVRVVERQDKVQPDDARVVGRGFPEINREASTVTLYYARKQQLATLAVAPELVNLPADSWRAGDEVRYYHKGEGRALRLMNVTRTDIRKVSK